MLKSKSHISERRKLSSKLIDSAGIGPGTFEGSLMLVNQRFKGAWVRVTGVQTGFIINRLGRVANKSVWTTLPNEVKLS